MPSRTKVVFGIKGGSFLSVAHDLRKVIGGRRGVYVRAFVDSGGEGKQDLRNCDKVSVEAGNLRDAEAVVVSLKRALVEATVKVTGVVDLSRFMDKREYKAYVSWAIGSGGGRIKALCGRCSGKVRVDADSNGGVVKVEASGKNGREGCAQAKSFLVSDIERYMARLQRTSERVHGVAEVSKSARKSGFQHLPVDSDDYDEGSDDETDSDSGGSMGEPTVKRTIGLRVSSKVSGAKEMPVDMSTEVYGGMSTEMYEEMSTEMSTEMPAEMYDDDCGGCGDWGCLTCAKE